MEQVLVIALIFLGLVVPMGLRLWAVRRHRAPDDGDPELLRRWARRLYRGDRED